MTSLAAGAVQKRQRRLNFQGNSDRDDSSDGYSSDSQSLSQQQDSQPGSTNPSLQNQFSTALSTQCSGWGTAAECNDQASSRDGHAAPVSTRRQALTTRQAAAPSNLPAIDAAMGLAVSETSRSAATRAATAAAVTPVAARHMSSVSGKTLLCLLAILQCKWCHTCNLQHSLYHCLKAVTAGMHTNDYGSN